MDTARIAALLQPFLSAGSAPAALSSSQLDNISMYIDILLRWNSRINLTAVRDPEEIVQRHFGESFFAARNLLAPAVSSVVDSPSSVSSASSVVLSPSSVSPASSVVHSPYSVADLGSGAGFPGLPLKLWAPQVLLTLIESNSKKATFLKEVVRALALTNVVIKNARAESLTETFDLVTLRAVEDFVSILPTAAALVAPRGRLALLIGSPQIEPAQTALPHFSWSEAIPIPHSRSRVVLAGSHPEA